MIVPSLTALFADPSWKLRSNEVPTFGSVLEHHLFQKLIILVSPCAFGAALYLILLLEAKVLQYIALLVDAEFCPFASFVIIVARHQVQGYLGVIFIAFIFHPGARNGFRGIVEFRELEPSV